MITSSGTIIRTAISGIKEMGRATQGVILMKTAKDEKLVSIATAEHEEEAEAIDGTEIVETVEETTEE
jgi:DNA gyrase subunit A